MLIVAGDHVPGMPLVDVVGSVAGVAPTQYCGMTGNVGVTGALTVTLIVACKAHWPADGVKVYVPEAVLLIAAGAHVPGIVGALVCAGKAGAGLP